MRSKTGGNWTPGPWEIMKCQCKNDVCDVWQLANVGSFYQGCGFSWDDAHLIAAAPEMYEALKVILPMAKGYADVNDVGNNKEMIDWAEAILAKAEGRRE